MKYIKYLNYSNLICGTVLLWTYLKSFPQYLDYLLIIGFTLTIWYNWETLKQLKGQKNKLNRLNYAIGVMTIIFGLLLLLGAAGMIKDGLKENSTSAKILIGSLYMSFGLVTIFLTLRTLKYYKIK